MSLPQQQLPPSSDAITGVSLSIYMDGQRFTICDENGRQSTEISIRDRIFLGRQDIAKDEPEPFHVVEAHGDRKLIIAPYQQREISRLSLEIQRDPESNRIGIRNIGTHDVNVSSHSGGHISHQQVRTFQINEFKGQPLRLVISHQIAIQLTAGETAVVTESRYALTQDHSALSQSVSDATNFLKSHRAGEGHHTPGNAAAADVERVLNAVSKVLEKAASSPDFYQSAVDNVCLLGNFDLCAYLALNKTANRWQCEATSMTSHDMTSGFDFDPHALEQIWRTKSTWTNVDSQPSGATGSENLVVVAPILSDNEVSGVIYASKQPTADGDHSVSDCDTKIVEVIRDCVAVGIERLDKEREAAQSQIRLAQFFPDALAERLQAKPELLDTREDNVTIMHLQVEGFHRICSRFGTRQLLQWSAELHDMLLKTVVQHHGVPLDTMEGHLSAVWGAPEEQLIHAEMSVRAAIDLCQKIDAMNESWNDRIPIDLQPFGISIGIHSGPSILGLKGSSTRFNWGPIGLTCEVSNCLHQAATQIDASFNSDSKAPSAGIFISAATQTAIPSDVLSRCLGWMKFANMSNPVQVFEVSPKPSPQWQELRDKFHAAYQSFENRDFPGARSLAEQILQDPQWRSDFQTQSLYNRIVSAMNHPQQTPPEHPVWVFDSI